MSTINVGFDNNSPQAIERAAGTLVAGKTTPYVSAAAAIAAVPAAYRYRGKTVLVDDGTGLKEYWWRVDTQDASLVPKMLGPFVMDFVVGDGGATTPAAGQPVYTDPAIKNSRILSFEIEGSGIRMKVRFGTIYGTYDPVAGTITLTNTLFSTDSWCQTTLIQL